MPCTTPPSSCLPKARTLPFPGSWFREGGRFAYPYDMGDYWEHEVIVLDKGRDRHEAIGLSVAEAKALLKSL